MTTVILTGGKSTRMGRDKALLKLNGENLSLALADRFSKALGPVMFSVDEAGRFPCGDYPELADRYPGRGPMNGIISGFEHAGGGNILLLATDMPYADPALALELERRLGGHDICAIRRKSGHIETLFAVYGRRCLETALRCIGAGYSSILAVYDRLDALLIDEDELSGFDLDTALFNMNTPESYDACLQKAPSAGDSRGGQTMPKVDVNASRDALLRLIRPMGTEKVSLWDGLGRVLAGDMLAGLAVPPFDRSPLDGYALRSEDTARASAGFPVTLCITEDIPAGKAPTMAVTPGSAAKVSTGAPIPEGADAVVKFEDTVFTADHVAISAPVKPGSNLVLRGEDAVPGTLIAGDGEPVTAAVMGMLAGQGIAEIKVYKRPRIAVLNTGTELLKVGEPLRPAKIYNSNIFTVGGFIRSLGAEVVNAGAVPDDLDAISARIAALMAEYDMVVTTGGASVGDYDWAGRAAEKIGAEVLFRELPMKPGGSILAAVKDGKVLLSLSGNPGAAVDGLLKIGAPAIRALCGRRAPVPEEFELAMESSYHKPCRKTRLLRGQLVISEGRALFRPTDNDKNSRLSPLLNCDVIGELPAGSSGIEAGELIRAWRVFD
jgi:molybdopterin molybdotransferase